MAAAVGIMGESGAGKTTSLRNLDPKTTYIIDADMKGLSWKGWKKAFNAEAKNYIRCNNKEKVAYILNGIAEKRPDIKTVVIDTMNGIMVADEIARMKEKGYDKWVDLAVCVMGIIDSALDAREDLTVVMVFHSQTIRDDSGNVWTTIKTNGQKLGKIVLESKLPIVLLAKCVDGEYIFETQANNSTAKSPMGMLEKQIPNDVAAVIEAMRKYEEDE